MRTPEIVGEPMGNRSMSKIKFTARTIEAIRAAETGRVEYWDSTTPGFGLRVTGSGTKTWFVRYRFGGRMERLKIGTYPALSLADARGVAEDTFRAVAKGLNPADQKRAGRKAETFRDLADRYIEQYAKLRKRSWRRDKEILDRDVLPAIGQRKAKDISRADVKEVLRAIINRNAPVMANRTLEVVRRIFNWAIEEEVADVLANPCQRLKPPGDEKSRDRVLNEREIKAFWHTLDVINVSPAIRLALKFILVTGQRKGEVAAAGWQDVDLDAQVWTIPAEHSKNGLPHRVPLSPLALDLLNETQIAAGTSPFLFPSPLLSRPIRETAINDAVYRNRAAFGIEAFTPHDLRRTAATQMASLGVPRLTIGKVLNHIEPGVTSIYDRHSYDVQKRRALDAWSQRVAQIVGLRADDVGVVNLEQQRAKSR